MNPCKDTSPDHTVIYLQPRCCDAGDMGRLWCEHPQEPCEECGAEWIKFVRADAKKAQAAPKFTNVNDMLDYLDAPEPKEPTP